MNHSDLELKREPNVLKIDVIEANKLVIGDSATGSSDPYVVIHMVSGTHTAPGWMSEPCWHLCVSRMFCNAF